MALRIKRSPRAPSMPLDEAIARVARMYKAEGRHLAPVEVAIKHIGYNSKNGSAIAAVASLGYWGLIERPKDGMVMVAKVYEDYEFTPDDAHKRELLIQFLRNPPLFTGLLDQYGDRLPSDATLKYDLIQKGFLPDSADTCVSVFKKSVEFARYFDRSTASVIDADAANLADDAFSEPANPHSAPVVTSASLASGRNVQAEQERQATQRAATTSENSADATIDRIPVRLAGGRRAWLEIPTPFFSADKKRLKQHIDLLLTDDEDEYQQEEL